MRNYVNLDVSDTNLNHIIAVKCLRYTDDKSRGSKKYEYTSYNVRISGVSILNSIKDQSCNRKVGRLNTNDNNIFVHDRILPRAACGIIDEKR